MTTALLNSVEKGEQLQKLLFHNQSQKKFIGPAGVQTHDQMQLYDQMCYQLCYEAQLKKVYVNKYSVNLFFYHSHS